MNDFDRLFQKLRNLALSGSANTKCKDLTEILNDLGFQIRDGKNAGHKVAIHPAIPFSESVNYNCGHNQGTSVRPFYIKHLYKFVKLHEDAIKEYLQ